MKNKAKNFLQIPLFAFYFCVLFALFCAPEESYHATLSMYHLLFDWVIEYYKEWQK